MSEMKETKKKEAGREPIANKSSVYEVLKEIDYTAQDVLSLSDQQKKYLKKNGIVHRFVYKKEYLKNNNFHRSGWQVVADPNMPGSNAEGHVEIGDLILAVKTTSSQQKYKDLVRSRINRMTGQASKVEAEKLLENARQSGLSAQIHVGYEENGDDPKDD